MRKYLPGAALILLLAVSCNPDKDLVKATVVDTGDIAQDGCGYVLKLENGKLVRPAYIPSAFQSNGMHVKVKYNTNGQEEICHTHPVNTTFEVVEIAKIEKDLD
ncbi:hypothetical protein [Polluticoccus soli]|uniref:hypothetical protein n=1 Tax=Polluticoccus soli TaxID=3034150 RepID=UPI0023E1BC99|nr:hypothetical protein [Flavipsychrobacter sp. JY13-12]